MADLYAGCETWEDHFDRANELYYPSFPGLHVCGSDPTETFPITVADFPLRSDTEARRIFDLVKIECEAGEGEDDLVVDLNVHNAGGYEDCVEADFMMSRQMLSRLAAMITFLREE